MLEIAELAFYLAQQGWVKAPGFSPVNMSAGKKGALAPGIFMDPLLSD
ncbi:MAG TPA: hypothetical protein VEV40_17130 [Alloacidobacterium sp.]|nr:hypothetical protein [Alloacidobacterium sp.]